MIYIQNLVKKYNHLTVLNKINLHIRKGIITGLLGPNGVGKTTLVSILIGIIKKDSGTIKINDLDLDENLFSIQSFCSIVPQTPAYYHTLNVYENLEYFGALHGLVGKKLKANIDFVIDVASLQDFLKKKAGKLSGGMSRRLNLAIGLLNKPKVLFLDEPTVGVDAHSRAHILEMISKINEETKNTIIYTSHYFEEIEKISEHIILIDRGQIILNDRKNNILDSNHLFLIEFENSNYNNLPHHLINEKVGFIEGNCLYIYKNENFNQNIVDVFSALQKNNTPLKNIQWNVNKLEKIYLQLIKQ